MNVLVVTLLSIFTARTLAVATSYNRDNGFLFMGDCPTSGNSTLYTVVPINVCIYESTVDGTTNSVKYT